MPNKALIHFEKVKAKTALGKMFKHNFRQDYCENVDKSRSYLNETLIDMGEGETYQSALNARIKKSSYYTTHKVRKDAVLGMDVNLSFGKTENVGPEFDLDLWKKQSVEWLKETFGEDNVVSAVLHMDESQPHIHAFVIPMCDERLNCKKYTGGRKQMSEIQSSYGDKMQNLGLERGAEYSVAKHEDIQAFYGAVKKRQIEKLPECREEETAEQYRIRAQADFTAARFQDLNKINTLTHENSALKGNGIKVREQEREIEQLKNELNQKIEEAKSYANKLRRWTELSYGIQNKLPDTTTAAQTFALIKQVAELAREDMEKKGITVTDLNKDNHEGNIGE